MGYIATMTMEEYMAKTYTNDGVGVVRPRIKENTEFEIKGHSRKELREIPYSGAEHEDANEHIKNVLEITNIFHVLKETGDQVILRIFPNTLIR